jgi:pyridoxal phosphate enzyme (YggS family)
MADAMTLSERLASIRARIAQAAARAGRAAESVELVAVTKTLSAQTVRAAYDLGLRRFGENRVQEAREKIPALGLAGSHWELIGHLQTNKAGPAVELFERIQSVDSVRLAEALSVRAHATARELPILLEVNVAGEASKSGFAPAELSAAAMAIERLPGLRIQGLMTIAPIATDPELVRPVFRQTRELLASLREAGAGREGWDQLSMGMSDDFEVAIEEGATLIRLGRALFGERATPPNRVQ